MQLTFTTESDAINAEKTIWINIVKLKFSEDKNGVGTGEIEYDSLEKLSNDEIASLKIYGLKSKKFHKQSGATTRYSSTKKAYQLEKWHFSRPSTNLMKNVVNYQEEEFNNGWMEPFEDIF